MCFLREEIRSNSPIHFVLSRASIKIKSTKIIHQRHRLANVSTHSHSALTSHSPVAESNSMQQTFQLQLLFSNKNTLKASHEKKCTHDKNRKLIASTMEIKFRVSSPELMHTSTMKTGKYFLWIFSDCKEFCF